MQRKQVLKTCQREHDRHLLQCLKQMKKNAHGGTDKLFFIPGLCTPMCYLHSHETPTYPCVTCITRCNLPTQMSPAHPNVTYYQVLPNTQVSPANQVSLSTQVSPTTQISFTTQVSPAHSCVTCTLRCHLHTKVLLAHPSVTWTQSTIALSYVTFHLYV